MRREKGFFSRLFIYKYLIFIDFFHAAGLKIACISSSHFSLIPLPIHRTCIIIQQFVNEISGKSLD